MEKRLVRLLLVGEDFSSLESLGNALTEENSINVSWVHSGKEAVELVAGSMVDVVVTAEQLADGPALPFVQELIKKQPLVNCAMVSSLSHDEFHQATEGLGIFMQLPMTPGAGEATKMVELLESIRGLMAA